MPQSQPVQSIERALDLLESVVAAPGHNLTLQQLSEAAELKTTTTFNLARTLVERGYLRKTPTRPVLYSPGPALDKLARRLKPSIDLGDTLLRLAEAHSGWQFIFAESEGAEIVQILSVNAATPQQVQEGSGRGLAAYTTASALCHQTFWSDERAAEFEAVYPFELYGIGFWGSRRQFKSALAAFRKAGIVKVIEHRPPRMAAPVYDSTGSLVLSLGASCPRKPRPSTRECDELATALIAAAATLTTQYTGIAAPATVSPQHSPV